MNRLHCTCVGLAATLAVAAMPAGADPAPDTWHGGGVDVIIAEPGPVPAGLVEHDEDVTGILPSTGWVSVFGIDLRGRTGPYEYTTSDITGAQWCTGTERFADSRIELPHNANITFFRMWGVDNSADHDVGALLMESCLPNLGPGDPVTTVLQDITSTGTPGAFSVTSSPGAGPTNLETCTYHVRARFGAGCAGGGLTTLRKVRVQYTLAP
jgi:hypothetical protein